MSTTLLFNMSAIVEILAGLCICNVSAAIVFVTVGASGGMNGILMWPAAILHAVIGAMMLWVILAAPHDE